MGGREKLPLFPKFAAQLSSAQLNAAQHSTAQPLSKSDPTRPDPTRPNRTQPDVTVNDLFISLTCSISHCCKTTEKESSLSSLRPSALFRPAFLFWPSEVTASFLAAHSTQLESNPFAIAVRSASASASALRRILPELVNDGCTGTLALGGTAAMTMGLAIEVEAGAGVEAEAVAFFLMAGPKPMPGLEGGETSLLGPETGVGNGLVARAVAVGRKARPSGLKPMPREERFAASSLLCECWVVTGEGGTGTGTIGVGVGAGGGLADAKGRNTSFIVRTAVLRPLSWSSRSKVLCFAEWLEEREEVVVEGRVRAETRGMPVPAFSSITQHSTSCTRPSCSRESRTSP
mmetsp:Transcript_13981/g.23115  ORF Transcript_13981/g.23115 Transcript_13981/m.23115 type:complete len:346 (+) Transcript_13981:465-1502(+)